MKNIAIVGASGSVGTQTLDVLRKEKGIVLSGVTVHRNLSVLKDIIEEFHPSAVAVTDESIKVEAEELLKSIGFRGETSFGSEGLIHIATLPDTDTVVTSLVGMVGLKPTIAAIENGKNIALANKETLVAAGELVMPLAKKHNVRILPVDSEHSAVFQSLQGSKHEEIQKIILTASGGPFRGKDQTFLKTVTREMALKHPNWVMGAKITIDSSTLMNKGLEVIEAKWLFDVDYNQIEVLVHPESIIHSMVEFVDNSIIAQLGAPDMRLPIQYALNYPHRTRPVAKSLNLLEISKLTFEAPDRETFRALDLAYTAGKRGGLQTAVMNSANEEAVALFLENQIQYQEIVEVVEQAMDAYRNLGEISLEKVISAHDEVKTFVRNKMKR
ncbi:1-deoxy-D-xylulose-5-phosphate reductoisomerase [Proteiniclasticum ruminis]|uniref:1-deoxy-D-xylulose 5-phosphate reductoisomerase n=1 Tax=Proteiniclasticum ruminis TaxID=398199 RepID=A0A1I4YET4_9CLOT|nr:1-deoxy-D-xylulose-5-phosphate reductoisomerase [Proteiniclasticum ruminis]SFN36089.1 1-deoxy-D-xylulose 5-phosphate reductoisomerase [Proteiniclasticum ruminis]